MKKINNIIYGADGDKRKALDVYLPDSNSFDAFVYFHGGGLESGDKSEADTFAQYLAEKNTAVISADYRMYPSAVYPEFIRDAAEAAAWTYKNILAYGECRRLYIGGSSAGAYISMMLCFDKRYLAPYGINPLDIDGFIHNAGQPTVHFNVLRERGIDSRRIIVDESAPLYHVGMSESYPPMLFIAAQEDIAGRYEQLLLMISTLRNFQQAGGLKIMPGGHCEYIGETDENGQSVFGKIIYEFINKGREKQ